MKQRGWVVLIGAETYPGNDERTWVYIKREIKGIFENAKNTSSIVELYDPHGKRRGADEEGNPTDALRTMMDEMRVSFIPEEEHPVGAA